MSIVYRSVANKDIETHLSLLLNLSKKIEIKLGVSNSIDKPDDDFFEEAQNQEANDIDKSLSYKDINQSIFLQFLLLFTGTKLNTLLTTSVIEKYKMQKKLNTLFMTINKFLPKSQKLMSSAIEFDQVFPSLFESGFFKKLSKYFFHNVEPITKAINRPESIFGIIVGLSLQNKNLIRNSLVKLIGPEIKPKFINGVFGFIVNDPSQEKDMRAVMKKVNLNPSLGLSLVELVTDSTERDKYNAALSVCKKYCTASNRVSALVAMFKKDLSNIRVVSEKLDLETDIMSAVLACATQRIDLLKENFKTLSYKLGINNTFALRSILSIACGKTREIHDLKEKKNSHFHIKSVDLLESIMFLIREGTKMRDEHTRFDIKDSTFACQTLYDAFKKVFGITRSKPIETEEEDLSARQKSMLAHTDKSIDLSDDNVSSSYDEGFHIQDLMAVEDALLANIRIIVDACWNDGKALSILADAIVSNEKKNPGSVFEIWSKFGERGKEILVQKLRKIYDDAVEAQAKMDRHFAKKIKENMKYVEALEKGDTIEFDNLTEDEQKVLDKLTDNDQKLAYKIGCTYNITGFRELNQEYMLCETCEETTGEDVIVCLCCKEFCHAGHRLMKGNKGKRNRVVCSCGSNTFLDCPVNDKGNSLAEIKGEGSLPETKCSLIKEYTAHKEKMGEKIRDLLSKQSLNKASKKHGNFLSGMLGAAKKNKTLKLKPTQKHREDRKESLSDESKNESDDGNDTIGKLEKELEEINSGVAEDKDFEGGEGSDLEHVLSDTNAGEGEADSDEDGDQMNEAEEYEYLMTKYTSRLFMKDLINVLKFDTTEVAQNCPKLAKSKFRVFDESLERKAHIYEHIIHLAHGFCRPGLIKLVTHGDLMDDDSLYRASRPYEPGHNVFFDTCMSYVSAFQGDLENFSKYSRGLLIALGLEGSTEFTAREKAIK